MPSFSKTRIFYYSNDANTYTTASTSSDFIISKITPDNNAFYCIGLKAEKHNWHFIPTNCLGLYMTTADLQMIVENSDAFKINKYKITIGHTIPIAKYPGTVNTVQLSFNNTIYSTIALEDSNYIGCNTSLSADEFHLIRTFDGVSSKDGKSRVELPKRNMFFRIPATTTNDGGSLVDNTTTKLYGPYSNTPGAITGENTKSTNNSTIADLINYYIPELLQNNDKVFALYPGENIYTHEQSIGDVTTNIECTGPHFNELIYHADQRVQC